MKNQIHTLTGKASSREVFLDGKPLNPKFSQIHRNHSPDGFNWGYGGSGPAQLALAVTLALTGTVERYQDFKFKVIGGLPQNEDFTIKLTVNNGIIIPYES